MVIKICGVFIPIGDFFNSSEKNAKFCMSYWQIYKY